MGNVCVEKIIYSSGEVLKEVRRIRPDVVFLDIEMPEISGLELSEEIWALGGKTEVVFITAFSEYALEAFRVNAIDYIMKQVDPKELERVILKIMRKNPRFAGEPAVRVRALGSFETKAAVSNEPVRWKTAKCEEFFAYLLFNPTFISKWKLMELLWPNRPESKGDANLRSTVSRVNKTFKEYGIDARIVCSNNHYRLDIDRVVVDAFEMERITEEYIKNDFSTMPTLKEFCSLYTGSLFDDRCYSWAGWMQEYYQNTFINFGKRLVLHRMRKNMDEDVTNQMIGYLVEIDPFNEEIRRLAMELIFKTKGKRN